MRPRGLVAAIDYVLELIYREGAAYPLAVDNLRELWEGRGYTQGQSVEYRDMINAVEEWLNNPCKINECRMYRFRQIAYPDIMMEGVTGL